MMQVLFAITFLCVALLPVLNLAAPQQFSECSNPNEVYRRCGSACPRTCTNMDKIFYCIAPCRSGCFCRNGYVRNAENKCVEVSQ
uniref:TIL domain-containing cysteine-rich salivary secreted peptide n=1 Tax=Ochlerotatus triseriatus TaxID=7162 RepID=C6ZQZ3_OCHTR